VGGELLDASIPASATAVFPGAALGQITEASLVEAAAEGTILRAALAATTAPRRTA
jgi:hypothetical protein